MRIVKPKRSGQEFLHDHGLQVVFRTVKQEANLAEQLLVRGEGTGTGLGSLHRVIHVRLWFILGACPTLTVLLRRMIHDQLRRARPEKILNVFQRIRLRFFQACGLASGRTSFASSRTAMSDRLLGEKKFYQLIACWSKERSICVRLGAIG